MIKHRLLYIFSFLSLSIYAETLPIPGSALAVPGSLSGLPFAAPSALFSNEDTRSSAFNPAAAADRNLPLLGLATSLAFPTASGIGGSGLGGSFSTAATFPTAFGVNWALLEANIGNDDLAAWPIPSSFSAALGISKPASDSLSLGLSLGSAFAPNGWTISAALGAELSLPNLAPAGAKVSAALLNLGPSLSISENLAPLLAPMPFFALRYGLIENKDIGLALSASLALPALVDLSTMLGASLSIGNLFFIDAGWRWSLSNALNYFDGGSDKALYAFQALPSISVRLNADTFLRLGSYGASFGLTSRPIAASVYAAEASLQLSAGSADLEGPRISIGTDNKAIWSEALHAEAAFSLSIQDASRLVSWSVLAYDQEGKSIFKIGEDSSLIEKAAKSRLLSVKKNLYPPKGFAIPLAGLDGSYRIRGSARDEYGNEAKSQEFEFIVDSKAPTATVSLASPAIFTPNGDGRRDLLSVEQSGSQERLWKGSFLDAGGRIVKNLSWSEGKPENFAWDGRDDGGNIVPDGKYSYELSSIDEAGNRGTAVISGIIIDAEKPSLDISLSSRILSSEGELRFSSITATIQLSSSRSLDSWTISVIDEKGKSQRSWKGEKAKLELFPTSLRFDGRTAQGDYLADGQYRFRAELFYANGNTPLATSTSFLIDSEKPSGRVRSSVNVINPERGISTELFHDLSSLSTWRGLVLDSDDKIVKSFDIKGAGESSLSWDGLSDEREPLPEGTYHYLAEGRSQAGLVSRTSSVNIKIEKGGLEAALMVDRPLFSSRVGEGKIRFLTRIEKRERILSYSLEIGSSTQALVRRFEGLANVPAALAWDGRDDFGVLVPDGRYQAKLRLQLDGSSQAGASIETAPAQFTIDSTPPEAKVQLVNQLFSPNGNSKLDSILIHQETSAEEVWLGKIIDEKGGIARSYSWKTRPPASLSWDGTDGSGAVFPDGLYRYQLSSTDSAGNASTITSSPFRLDARLASASLSADKIAFSPNGDGFADTLSLQLLPSFSDGLSQWSLVIQDAAGKKIKTLGASVASPQGARGEAPSPASSYTWDGTDDSGKRVPDATYSALAELRYLKGDIVRAKSAAFVMDTEAPRVSFQVGPLPFSPDGDGVNDVLSLSISATDASPIAAWLLSISDPTGYPFTRFSGKELPPSPILWDGSNLDGDLVEAAQDYTYTLLVRDSLGNTRKLEGMIPVDVFVLRDGDRLKIRVSSIVFPPSSASLTGNTAEIDIRNGQVLDRIATVLQRFPEYRIRVEGHAVNLSGTEREERTELEPLSLSRARSVLLALSARGVPSARLEARGLGGREPIVPHGDEVSRWRNRRVEFILVR